MCPHAIFKLNFACCCGMQNPVVSLALIIANTSLLGPLLSFLIDTRGSCQGLRQAKMVMFVFNYVVAANLLVMLPHQLFRLLQQYDFSMSFRSQYYFVGLVNVAAYAVVVHAARRGLEALQRSRVHPL